MNVNKFILAAVTTRPEKVPQGTTVFICDSIEEMESVTASLEAILDGIAHGLTDDLYIIVKH